MISREHAPPMNPSMRPSANTIARSPRWADTGARRATTVATANDSPSRRKVASCSNRSMAFISTNPRRHAIRHPLEQPRGARFQRLEPTSELSLELDRDEPRRPHVARPFILEQAVQQRERLIIAPGRFVRQPFQVSPLESLFRQLALHELHQHDPIGLERNHRLVPDRRPHLDGKPLAQERYELFGNDRDLVEVPEGGAVLKQ